MDKTKLALLHYNRNQERYRQAVASNFRLVLLRKKTHKLYRDDDLENWGFAKKDPIFRCDINGSARTSDDYYRGPDPGYLLIPVGTIFQYAGPSVPDGHFFCNGDSKSKYAYTRLSNVLGNTYGTATETHFYLPNFKGRVPIGEGNQTGTDFDLGATGGNETHTLTIDQMPSHNHGGTTSSDGAHTHTVNNQVQQNGLNTCHSMNDGDSNEINNINLIPNATSSNGAHTHTISAQGGGEAFDMLPPYIVINYIIRY